MYKVEKQEKGCEGGEGSHGGQYLEGTLEFFENTTVRSGKRTNTNSCNNIRGESVCKSIARHIGPTRGLDEVVWAMICRGGQEEVPGSRDGRFLWVWGRAPPTAQMNHGRD